MSITTAKFDRTSLVILITAAVALLLSVVMSVVTFDSAQAAPNTIAAANSQSMLVPTDLMLNGGTVAGSGGDQ